jgi:hypothetical protein
MRFPLFTKSSSWFPSGWNQKRWEWLEDIQEKELQSGASMMNDRGESFKAPKMANLTQAQGAKSRARAFPTRP